MTVRELITLLRLCDHDCRVAIVVDGTDDELFHRVQCIIYDVDTVVIFVEPHNGR